MGLFSLFLLVTLLKYSGVGFYLDETTPTVCSSDQPGCVTYHGSLPCLASNQLRCSVVADGFWLDNGNAKQCTLDPLCETAILDTPCNNGENNEFYACSKAKVGFYIYYDVNLKGLGKVLPLQPQAGCLVHGATSVGGNGMDTRHLLACVTPEPSFYNHAQRFTWERATSDTYAVEEGKHISSPWGLVAECTTVQDGCLSAEVGSECVDDTVENAQLGTLKCSVPDDDHYVDSAGIARACTPQEGCAAANIGGTSTSMVKQRCLREADWAAAEEELETLALAVSADPSLADLVVFPSVPPFEQELLTKLECWAGIENEHGNDIYMHSDDGDPNGQYAVRPGVVQSCVPQNFCGLSGTKCAINADTDFIFPHVLECLDECTGPGCLRNAEQQNPLPQGRFAGFALDSALGLVKSCVPQRGCAVHDGSCVNHGNGLPSASYPCDPLLTEVCSTGKGNKGTAVCVTSRLECTADVGVRADDHLMCLESQPGFAMTSAGIVFEEFCNRYVYGDGVVGTRDASGCETSDAEGAGFLYAVSGTMADGNSCTLECDKGYEAVFEHDGQFHPYCPYEKHDHDMDRINDHTNIASPPCPPKVVRTLRCGLDGGDPYMDEDEMGMAELICKRVGTVDLYGHDGRGKHVKDGKKDHKHAHGKDHKHAHPADRGNQRLSIHQTSRIRKAGTHAALVASVVGVLAGLVGSMLTLTAKHYRAHYSAAAGVPEKQPLLTPLL